MDETIPTNEPNPTTSLESLVDAFIESIPEQVERTELLAIVHGKDASALPKECLNEGDHANPAQVLKMIGEATIPQKIKLAMFGNQTVRTILIRDSNRQIPMFVLENGRLTENEIFEFSRNTNVSDSVLRAISNNTEWMKSYQTRLALVTNPKTPIDASLRWLKYLQTSDLRRLAKSKNIPQTVATQARKLSEAKRV